MAPKAHSSIRQTIATVIWLALVAAVGAAGGAWWHYHSVAQERTRELAVALAQAQQRQADLERMVTRLTDHKVLAQVVVSDQKTGPSGFITQTTLLLVRLGPDEKPITRQTIVIPGQTAYFEGLVVKFDHDAVAMAHPLRGRNIALLRRIYSERIAPIDGIEINPVGEIPPAYRDDRQATDFERKLWQRFWDLCNDPQLAAQFGVRVAQGEAVYKPMKPGLLYEIALDNSGGMNLVARSLPEAVAEALQSLPEP